MILMKGVAPYSYDSSYYNDKRFRRKEAPGQMRNPAGNCHPLARLLPKVAPSWRIFQFTVASMMHPRPSLRLLVAMAAVVFDMAAASARKAGPISSSNTTVPPFLWEKNLTNATAFPHVPPTTAPLSSKWFTPFPTKSTPFFDVDPMNDTAVESLSDPVWPTTTSTFFRANATNSTNSSNTTNTTSLIVVPASLQVDAGCQLCRDSTNCSIAVRGAPGVYCGGLSFPNSVVVPCCCPLRTSRCPLVWDSQAKTCPCLDWSLVSTLPPVPEVRGGLSFYVVVLVALLAALLLATALHVFLRRRKARAEMALMVALPTMKQF
ncbi:Aste57867_11204 [Aphanomyces stellatus]|uniref:Aste57867_11204 protein n=1 Tax=Aphanomyces stellatus TaxID=120398 RepID=A0A485KU72_9STRA|nr:hypothetical protein As57867_011162 [Aphanomyces stellatus]VFT88071.1 Aste57867_11204 [Aphanomyces stellatus]